MGKQLVSHGRTLGTGPGHCVNGLGGQPVINVLSVRSESVRSLQEIIPNISVFVHLSIPLDLSDLSHH